MKNRAPNWERLPNWEVVIDPTPSIHSRMPIYLENTGLYVNGLYLLQYTFFFYEKPSPTSPGAKLSLSKPTWHRLPNWEKID